MQSNLITPYLRLLADRSGSDLYFSTGARPKMMLDGRLRDIGNDIMAPGRVDVMARSGMNEAQASEFDRNGEVNFALSMEGLGRFRVNVFRQRGETSMVIRLIREVIPTLGELGLPPVLGEIIKAKTGLVLMVGATGSGKSSSLAAMINHRNETSEGHILTLEDPLEFVHPHKGCIINQREIGTDTASYASGLKEAMREAPHVILIGEIRDRQVMEHAIAFANTGHLCVSTLHATNTAQALDRILRFFPLEARDQLLMDLSMNLKAIVSQRLVIGLDGKRKPAVEVLLNTPYISDLILRGRTNEIPEVMERGGVAGMQTFDGHLFEMYQSEIISKEEALRHATSRSNLEHRMAFGDGRHNIDGASSTSGAAGLLAALNTPADASDIPLLPEMG